MDLLWVRHLPYGGYGIIIFNFQQSTEMETSESGVVPGDGRIEMDACETTSCETLFFCHI